MHSSKEFALRESFFAISDKASRALVDRNFLDAQGLAPSPFAPASPKAPPRRPPAAGFPR